VLKYIFGVLILLSVLYAVFSGNINDVSAAALQEGVNAVNLCVYMLGGMCVWGGILKIAEKSGITALLSKGLKPFAKLLFKNINWNGKAYRAMSMNIIANILGLGNAATPFGIEAMQELSKEEKANGKATDNMVMFTVLNTASITLIPATVAALRFKAGSEYPLDILPAILINSLLSVTAAVVAAKLFRKQQ
jgi:spore maturation protein A